MSQSVATHLRLLIFMLVITALAGCASSQPDPGKRTSGQFIDDNVLERRALVAVRNHNESLERANLVVVSFNGAVLLAGQVSSEDDKRTAGRMVDEMRGVRRVYNELEVAGNTSLLTRSGDTWVTSKVKTQLLTEEAVRGLHIKVVTENGVTYLMGLVTREEADMATDIARNTGGVRQVVRLFEYVDDD